MRAKLLAAFLAACSTPSIGAVVAVEGDFGPTTSAPFGAPFHFKLNFEYDGDMRGSLHKEAILTDLELGSVDITNVVSPSGFALVGGMFAFGTPYFYLGGTLSLDSGERLFITFALSQQGNALFDPLPHFNNITVDIPGSVFTERYYYEDPQAVTVSFDPDDITLPVPEPAIWLTMVGGFALIGGIMRRRSSAQAAAPYNPNVSRTFSSAW